MFIFTSYNLCSGLLFFSLFGLFHSCSSYFFAPDSVSLTFSHSLAPTTTFGKLYTITHHQFTDVVNSFFLLLSQRSTNTSKRIFFSPFSFAVWLPLDVQVYWLIPAAKKDAGSIHGQTGLHTSPLTPPSRRQQQHQQQKTRFLKQDTISWIWLSTL